MKPEKPATGTGKGKATKTLAAPRAALGSHSSAPGATTGAATPATKSGKGKKP